MSFGVHRQTDIVSPHSCPPGGPCGLAPPTQPSNYSSNVITNSLMTVRLGDTIIPHQCFNCDNCGPVPCCAPCSPHTGTYIGSCTVNTNSRPTQKLMDNVSCSSIVIQASNNVNIGS